MTKLEAILKQADSLSADERAQLVALLAERAGQEALVDEIAVGHRGLAAWTETTGEESWSEFYSDALRNHRGHET